jgi:hypothetical protein
VAPAAGDAVRVTATDLVADRPAYSPDGSTLWFVACEPDLAGRPTMLWSVPADGSGKPERLTDPERFDHDPAFGAGILPLLVDDHAVTTISLDRGAIRLLRFPVDGASPPSCWAAGAPCTTTMPPAGWWRRRSATTCRRRGGRDP